MFAREERGALSCIIDLHSVRAYWLKQFHYALVSQGLLTLARHLVRVVLAVLAPVTLAEVGAGHSHLVALAVLLETARSLAVAAPQVAYLLGGLARLGGVFIVDLLKKDMALLDGVQLLEILKLALSHNFLAEGEGVSNKNGLHHLLSFVLMTRVVLAALAAALSSAVSIVLEALAVELETA